MDPTRLRDLGGQTVDTDPFASIAQRRVDLSPVAAMAARRVGGAGIENAPSIQAARLAFRTGAQPNLTSQMTLRGLGRSTAVAPALARAEAEFLYPAIQDELAREERGLQRELGVAATGLGLAERGIERELGAAGQTAGYAERGIQRGLAAEQAGLGVEERGIERGLGAEQARLGFAERDLQRDIGLEERAIDRQLGANLQTVPYMLSAGGAETQRELAAVDAQLKAGGVERGIAQAQQNAQMQDYLRRQALSEQALFGPLGSVLPSAIGQTSRTESDAGGK